MTIWENHFLTIDMGVKTQWQKIYFVFYWQAIDYCYNNKLPYPMVIK